MPAQPSYPRAPGCDAPDPAPVYGIQDRRTGETTYVCRCVVCGRCGHHTGNSHQGHYWAYCQVSRQREAFHHCCPGNCELGEARP